jgi:hypothetical protein
MTVEELMILNKVKLEEVVKIAVKGTHCGMSIGDFLGSGN